MDEPGQIIIPHGPAPATPPNDGSPEPERPQEVPENPQPPAPSPEPSTPPDQANAVAAVADQATAEPPAQSPQEPLETSGGWFHQEQAAAEESADDGLPFDQELSWSASEFIAHEKGFGWYAVLAGGALVAAVLVFLVTKDGISTAVVLLAAAIFGGFAGRKPRTQQYNLSNRGLQIGQKFYNFQDFRTFSVSQEGVVSTLVFTPLKRFMPSLTVYLAPEVQEQALNFISTLLPFEQHKVDAVDSLLKRMRF